MATTTRSGSARVPFVLLLALMILHKPAGLAQAFPYRSLLQTCQPNGSITGKSGKCNTQNDSECCKDGQRYTTFACSPRVTGSTLATLMVNSFAEGGDGGGAAACTGRFYNDSQKVAALSTGWFNGRSRCEKDIVIRASNGRSVRAMVVDECNSMKGCDEENNYEPPCPNNIVNGSPAVWDALGLNKDAGVAQITWSDA